MSKITLNNFKDIFEDLKEIVVNNKEACEFLID